MSMALLSVASVYACSVFQ